MKAAFYIGTRSGLNGIGSVVTRFRQSGFDGLTGKNAPMSQISHCELVIEPHDGVDDLMPRDGLTMLPTAAPMGGALWLAGSSATDVMPPWSPRRAGARGGVRFKRIDVSDRRKWLLVELDHLPPERKRRAVQWMVDHQGALYDWWLIGGFVVFMLPDAPDRYVCHEALGAALGIAEPRRLPPPALCAVLDWRVRP